MRKLTVAQFQDLVVTMTVCSAILLVLKAACAVALLAPEKGNSTIGDVSITRGTGLGGILVGLYLVLRLVYKARESVKDAT